jgi:hypothetical protein
MTWEGGRALFVCWGEVEGEGGWEQQIAVRIAQMRVSIWNKPQDK